MERSAVLSISSLYHPHTQDARSYKFNTHTHKSYHPWHRVSREWSLLLTFRVCCYACGHGTRRFDPVYDELRCDEANETFSIDVTGSNRQFCAFMKPQTRTVIRPTPGLIIYITKCVIFRYMFCTILVVMLICNFFIMHYHVFLCSKCWNICFLID